MDIPQIIEKDFTFLAVSMEGTTVASTYLEDCWKHERFCDIQVSSQGKIFNAHKVILAAHSEYFRCMLDNPYFVDSNKNVITLDEVNSEILQMIFEYLYTGNTEVSSKNIASLIIATDYLSIHALKNQCEQYIVNNISKFNIPQCFFFCYHYSLRAAESLFKEEIYKDFIGFAKSRTFFSLPLDIVKYLIGNFETPIRILKSGKHRRPVMDSKLEEVLFSALINYISINLIYSEEDISELLKCILLPQIDLNFIVNVIDRYQNIKENEQIKNLIAASRNPMRGSKLPKKENSDFHKSWTRSREPLTACEELSERMASGREVGRKDLIKYRTNAPISTYIKSIVIISRLWDGREVIGGLQVTYWDGTVINYGELTKRHRRYDIVLEEDEVIVCLEIHSGFMVDSIKAKTNFGKSFGPFGGDGGGRRFLEPSSNEYFLHEFQCESVVTQGSRGIVMLSVVWLKLM